MSEQVLEIGDIVRLKSGGPDMTVAGEGSDLGQGDLTYECRWFDGKKSLQDHFPFSALERVPRSA